MIQLDWKTPNIAYIELFPLKNNDCVNLNLILMMNIKINLKSRYLNLSLNKINCIRSQKCFMKPKDHK